MFTGLVMDVGTLKAIRPEGESARLHIETRLAKELADGDSLAVNGVCLTITATRGAVAVALAVAETLSRTTLGRLGPGQKVNLEPALRVGDRLGGHIVQGHVDGVGVVSGLQQRGDSLELTVTAPHSILRYVVQKGSITIDGVSLTVASLARSSFTVALVPHTLSATTLEGLRQGASVNLENDVLAKYVEQMLDRSAPEEEPRRPDITEAWLRKKGF